ncbi:hypothetical protein [Cohnella panacarvi]|uniref:hypothetical protein n=1 Tax=Cohnella panacarvi TaxID=400776 RepID=UPI000479D1A2|nr:hypothetical protein [Cohnella panacarvi]
MRTEMNLLQALEEALNQSALVQTCLVVGQDRPYYAALIVPDLNELSRLVAEQEEPSSMPSLSARITLYHLEVRRYFCDVIHAINEQVPGDKKIERFALVTKDSQPQTQGSMEEHEQFRRNLYARNQEIVESFYQEIPPGIG